MEVATEKDAVVVAGTGAAQSPDPNLFDAKARATVRYADPAAWTVAAAVVGAISRERESVSAQPHEVGVIVISDQGPTETIANIAATALEGFSSPLRFPAASPGSLVGVSCIVQGFRGPTLNFAMQPTAGVPAALAICNGWLERGVARYMLLVTLNAAGRDLSARAVLLTKPGNATGCGEPMTPAVERWLMQTGD